MARSAACFTPLMAGFTTLLALLLMLGAAILTNVFMFFVAYLAFFLALGAAILTDLLTLLTALSARRLARTASDRRGHRRGFGCGLRQCGYGGNAER